MFALRETLLLCTIFFCLSSAKLPRENLPCIAEGQKGVCVLWSKCAPIAEMLRRNPPKESELIYAQKFNCGYRRHVPYYCCTEGMSSQPEVAPPQPEATQKPNRTNSNGEIKNVLPNLMDHKNRYLLPLETCGLVEKKYIVGGEQANLGEYPWLAAIHYTHKRRAAQFMCGGALINKHYVLTAAHCLHRDKLFGFRPHMVRLGEHNFLTNPDIEHGKEGRFTQADPVIDFEIEKMIIYEEYSARDEHQYHDIALIRLRGEAPETRYVTPICLPTPQVDQAILSSDDDLTVAGWGNTETGSRSQILMKVDIPVEGFNSCAKKYGYFGRNVTVSQLCAGMKGKDSCQGDSGGPLMGLENYANYNSQRWFAVGIVSYGHVRCGVYDYPGIYTRVLPYIGWILDHMEP